jgi:predicted dehydrogenase
MRVLLVGLGSIGRRHLANLLRLSSIEEVVVLRRPESQWAPSSCADASGRVTMCHDLEAALEKPLGAAIICSPAPAHLPVGLTLAERGVNLFVEKPLSDGLDGVDHLLATCTRTGAVLQVGYNLRFHPPLVTLQQEVASGRIGRLLSVHLHVGQYLPDWRPMQDYRRAVSAQRALGGGALLELSHEIDGARWLAGEVRSVFAHTSRQTDLEIDVEDTADLVLRCGTVTASVHMDMSDRAAVRSYRVIGSAATLTWDGSTDLVRLQGAGVAEDLHPAMRVDRNEMYLAELRQFFGAVEQQGVPAVTGQDGRAVLAVVAAARTSAIERRVVDV